MGLHYGFDLYFEYQSLGKALYETAKIADHSYNYATTVILPSGEKMILPFLYEPLASASNGVRLTTNGPLVELGMSILFSPDQALLNYADQRLTEDQRHVSIGSIYLMMTLGLKYVEFSFMAATSDMSRLFIASPSIQNTFLDLLRSASGSVGLINTGTEQYSVLGDIDRKVYLDREQFYKTNNSTLVDIDSFTTALLEKLL